MVSLPVLYYSMVRKRTQLMRTRVKAQTTVFRSCVVQMNKYCYHGMILVGEVPVVLWGKKSADFKECCEALHLCRV